MKLFFDTNVLLDILQVREKFVVDSSKVFSKCALGVHGGMFSSLSACNMVYVSRRYFSQEQVQSMVLTMSKTIRLLDTRAEEVAVALSGISTDFEDEVQRLCAENNGADVIITRDKDGFTNASIPVMTPTEFLDWQEQDQ